MKKNNKKMKKVILGVCMVLMIALVCGMGAMTYSRYVTSGSTTQTATAAKWGFVITANTDNLFGSEYKKDGTNTSAKVNGTGSVVVKGTSNAIVVAPGTEGSLTFSINGTAEVLAKISLTATGSDIHLGEYYPVKWTLKKGGSVVNGGEDKKLSEIVTLINNMTEETIQPNTSASNAGEYELSWKWAFDTNDANTNAKDTVIGYKAMEKSYDEIKDLYSGSVALNTIVANEAAYKAIVTEMTISLTISVEQVQ